MGWGAVWRRGRGVEGLEGWLVKCGCWINIVGEEEENMGRVEVKYERKAKVGYASSV